MGNEAQQIVEKVADKTNSELILFFILVLIALVIVFVPLYNMMRKDRKDRLTHENTRQDKYIEREKQIIAVITANTEVISGLKTMLEMSGTATSESFLRVNERIDKLYDHYSEYVAALARVQSTLDEIVRRQIEDAV